MDFWKSLDEAKVEDKKEFTKIPEGTYVADVTDVTIVEDMFQTSFDVEFTISDGEFKNRKTWYSAKIDEDLIANHPERLGYIKSAICKLAGVHTTDGKAMELLSSCKGNSVEIFVKHKESTKGDGKIYVNTYINHRLL